MDRTRVRLTDVPSTLTSTTTTTAAPSLHGSQEELPVVEKMESIGPDIENLSSTSGPVTDSTDEYPEGGRGWLVVLGSVCLTASTFGLVNSWGVFQAHYQTEILADVNPSTLAWIGSVQYALVFMPGLIVGRLFDVGFFHPTLATASALLVVSTFIVAECHRFWQFFLAQGLATGLACGFVFGGAFPVVSHWFKAKRNTAFGIVACGASYGGTLFPIITRLLLPKIGFPLTMRTLRFILLAHLILANQLVRRRLLPLPPSNMLDFRAFRSPVYSLYVACATVAFLGLYACLTFIDVSAIVTGVDPNLAFYLVSFGNAGSGVGRLLSGVLADRIGPLNTLIPFSVIAALFTIIWPFMRTEGGFVAVAILYGLSSGAFVGLLAAPVAQLGETTDVGRKVGLLFTVMSVGSLVGPPICGAIYSATGSFEPVGIYAGVTILIGSTLMFAARWKALGALRGRM